MTHVDIEYCVPCGHLQRAQDLQGTLLEQFGQDLEGVTLTTGDGGVFTVCVDDELVFDKSEDEYDVDAITREVRSHVTATA